MKITQTIPNPDFGDAQAVTVWELDDEANALVHNLVEAIVRISGDQSVGWPPPKK